MKILHLGKYFPPFKGGMETYLRDIMVALSGRGIDNLALVHQSDISLRTTSETYRYSAQDLAITRAGVWVKLLFTPVSPSFPWHLYDLTKANRPDILHIHMPNASAFWALMLPITRRIPWVIQWQSDVLTAKQNIPMRLLHMVYGVFERMMLKKARAVIVSSPDYLKASVTLRDFSEKCLVVPLGLNPANLSRSPQPRTQEGNGSDKRQPLKVLAVGRLTYYKGYEYLLRSAAPLEDVQINLVGKGDREQYLRTLVDELQLSEKVTFHGELDADELARQFSNCDCFCLPSLERTEAFGIVLLEAMWFGKATIISDVAGSGMGWIVHDGVTGIKVSPADPDQLTEALRYCRDNRDKLEQMGRRGKERFDQEFHIEKCCDNVIRIYKNVLDKA